MILDLNKEIDRAKFKKRSNELYEGKKVVELKEKRGRTLNQNNYMHLIFTHFGMEYGSSMAFVKHEYFKKLVNPEIFCITDTSGKVVNLRSTADLDTAETTKAIDRFRNWSSLEAGIYLPAPNEEEFLREIEIEAGRNNY